MASNAPTPGNLILSRCSPAFAASVETVAFRPGDVILRANQATAYAYFPQTLVATFVRHLLDGSTVEAGMVGFEGVIGLDVMFGAAAQPSDVIVQVEGTATRIPASAAGMAFDGDREFRGLVLRFANAFTLQIGQAAACNWFHSLERRLVLWLLRVGDRIKQVDGVKLSLTQEFLANMLGTRIASINEAISSLTASGLILHRRQLIEIVDRSGLEASACECYATIRALYERDHVL